MQFTKMHGAGNDYIYIDCFRNPTPDNIPELAVKISDRRFGVGGDGLVLIEPVDQADARMRMFNADGSEAEMCGNAIRCVAKYLYDHDLKRLPELNIQTGAGILRLNLEANGERVHRVTVDMGVPVVEASQIPTTIALEGSIRCTPKGSDRGPRPGTLIDRPSGMV